MVDLNVALILKPVDRATGPARTAQQALRRIGGDEIMRQAREVQRGSVMMHAAGLSSPRLQRVLSVLRDGRALSTRQIVRRAGVMAVGACVADLAACLGACFVRADGWPRSEPICFAREKGRAATLLIGGAWNGW